MYQATDTQQCLHYWNHQTPQHINTVELLAALFTITTFTEHIAGKSVALHIDNTTTISYIKRQGGAKIPLLRVATQLAFHCINHDIDLQVHYIPSAKNHCRPHLQIHGPR